MTIIIILIFFFSFLFWLLIYFLPMKENEERDISNGWEEGETSDGWEDEDETEPEVTNAKSTHPFMV